MERFHGGPETPEFKPAVELEPAPPEQSRQLGRAALDRTVQHDLAPAPATAWQPNVAPDQQAPRRIDEHSPHSESESARALVPEAAPEQPQPDTTTRPLGHTALSRTLQDLAPAPATAWQPEPAPGQQPATENKPSSGVEAVHQSTPDTAGRLDHTTLDRSLRHDLAPAPATAWQPEATSAEHPAQRTADHEPNTATEPPSPETGQERQPHPTEQLDYSALQRTVDLGPASPLASAARPDVPRQPEHRPATAETAVTAFIDESAPHRSPSDDSGQSGAAPTDDGYFTLAQTIGMAPADVTQRDFALQGAGLHRIEMLKEIPGVEIGGRPEMAVEHWRRQDHNDLGLQNTCGLKNVQEMASQLGVEKTQSQVVHMAVRQGLCNMDGDDFTKWGAVTREQQIALLESLGLEGKPLDGMGVDDVAALVEKGYGVAVEVQARDMIARYDDTFHQELYPPDEPNLNPDRPDHSLHITGTVRINDELVGFIANDPTWKPGVMIDVEEMRDGWENQGGQLLFVRRPEDPGY